MPNASVKSRGSRRVISELPLGYSIPSGKLQLMIIAVRYLGCSQQCPLGTTVRPRTAVLQQTAHGACAQMSSLPQIQSACQIRSRGRDVVTFIGKDDGLRPVGHGSKQTGDAMTVVYSKESARIASS